MSISLIYAPLIIGLGVVPMVGYGLVELGKQIFDRDASRNTFPALFSINARNQAELDNVNWEVLQGMVAELQFDGTDRAIWRNEKQNFEAEGLLEGWDKNEVAPGVFHGNLTVPMGKDKSPIEGNWLIVDPSKAGVKRSEEFSEFLTRLEKINSLVPPFLWDLKANERIGG